MKQPEEYNDGNRHICKMVLPLYGLKQAWRCWNTKFTDVLRKHSMIQSKSNHCLIIHKDEGHQILMSIYVDHRIVAGQNEVLFFPFVNELKQHFNLKVSQLSSVLGLQVEHLKYDSLFLHQEAFMKKILEWFGNAIKTSVIPVKKDSLKVE